jgi:hypothetical protein
MQHVDATDMRIQDEMVFKGLHTRVSTWLGSAQSPESGRQLFTDICAFAGDLKRVSERRELRVHDAEQIDGALKGLDAPMPKVDALTAAVQALEGLDDELDRLFELFSREQSPASVLAVRERLRTLRRQIPPSPPGEMRRPR